MSEIYVNGMRPEFHDIVSGWTLISGMEDITDRIDRAAEWTQENGPLLPAEEATISAMIRTQIARGIKRGDFDGLGLSEEEMLDALNETRKSGNK